MKRKKTMLAVALAALLLAGGATALATVGTSDNPLVTLGYLTDTFTTNILSKTQSKLDQAQSTYEKKLEEKIQTSSGGKNTTGAYSVVSLAKGQVITGSVGCEVMLRVGSASCVSSESPGLIDTTTGGTLEGGGSLVKNHLYIITVDTRGIQATSAGKILVRGPYSIR